MHLKKIPIGISDFKTIIEEGYLFVDKTLLIKEFWESNGQTILLPRPRRFGKTLNMSMIKYFFENVSIDNSYLFENLNIEKHEEIMTLQGEFPVIYLSFKDEKYSSFEYLREGLNSVFSKLFIEHEYCLNNTKLHRIDKEYYDSIINKQASVIELSNSLKKLSEYLEDYYKKR